MRIIKLAPVKPMNEDKSDAKHLVLAENEDGKIEVLKVYDTSANDARIFADVLCEMDSESICGYPDKIVKSKSEDAAVTAAADADDVE